MIYISSDSYRVYIQYLSTELIPQLFSYESKNPRIYISSWLKTKHTKRMRDGEGLKLDIIYQVARAQGKVQYYGEAKRRKEERSQSTL